ncbi:hypothetical protein N7520_010644 [Penicillium odoratum]|uniref:uncharacterized protein n=1 Tax=Penicillium odoratum TaxID=1167516 RepID=UPI0025469C41|nr:uncharacterized protein N7520_010644 [Penicillium odoratum]KAJ5745462.1 hypothetical protein N7520_010644 [Penicillium odoratum]
MGSTVDQKRPTRPKITKKTANNHQLDKKRIQNRTSQQCLRERKQAHTRHLESLAELMVVSQNDGDDPQKQNQALVACNLKLIEQNRQLQDALFRMKKKLLGVSNIAIAAASMSPAHANDEIFDSLVGNEGNKPKDRSDSFNDEDVNDEPNINKGQGPATYNHTSIRVSGSLAPSGEPTTLHHDASQRTELLETCEELSYSQSSPQCSPFDPPSFAMSNSLMQPFTFPSPLKKAGFKCVPTTMVGQLMKVCKGYLQQSSDASSEIPKWNEVGTFNHESPRIPLVDRLREVVVHILASWAGLESYLYGIGVFQHMERVVQWRLTRSLEDRLAIPEPFRPTPLQLNSDYPVCIDFLNWPTIRDQLILRKDDGDLGVFMRDIVMNTVIEFPTLNASVNIHDLFYNKISPGGLIPDFVCSPKISGNDDYDNLSECPAATDSEFAEKLIRRDLHQRLVHGLCPLTEDVWQSILCGVYLPAQPVFARPPLNLLAGCYGIDQVTKWKLSPAFARKYPSIDCVGVTANFEMIQTSHLPGL